MKNDLDICINEEKGRFYAIDGDDARARYRKSEDTEIEAHELIKVDGVWKQQDEVKVKLKYSEIKSIPIKLNN